MDTLLFPRVHQVVYFIAIEQRVDISYCVRLAYTSMCVEHSLSSQFPHFSAIQQISAHIHVGFRLVNAHNMCATSVILLNTECVWLSYICVDNRPAQLAHLLMVFDVWATMRPPHHHHTLSY